MDSNLTEDSTIESGITQLTQNEVNDTSPQISGNNIVWRGFDGNDDEVFLFEGETGTVTQLTDNEVFDSDLAISGARVVWSTYDGNDGEIFLYEDGDIIQLTDNDVGDRYPLVSDSTVAWLSYEGEPNFRSPPNSAIYFYDGTNTTRLTTADTYKDSFDLDSDGIVWADGDGNGDDLEIFYFDGRETIQITDNTTNEYSPQISGNNIAWTSYDGDDEVYLYNGSETIRLTDNDLTDSSIAISGNNVVWASYDGNDNEIFLYNGTETIQLTDNDLFEFDPVVSGDNVVWSAYPDDSFVNQVFYYNGSEVVQLTDNNDLSNDNPQIDGNNVVWSGSDGNDFEIFANYDLNLAPGSISGYKWHDVDADGVFDRDESGLEGWTIYLDSNGDGVLSDGEPTAITDAEGFYRFEDVAVGNYAIAEQPQPGWKQTFPSGIFYNWQDSRQPDGVTYSWQDISDIGTELVLADDGSALVDLPFQFAFFNEVNTNVEISANGYLTFGGNGNEYFNESITDSPNLDNFIAPFWDDLNPDFGGTVYYDADASSDRFIVQYQDVVRYDRDGTVTFQTILNADGSIIFQYEDLDAAVQSATVGLEGNTGDVGLQIVHEDRNFTNYYLKNELAIAFIPEVSANGVSNREVFVGNGEDVTEVNFGNVEENSVFAGLRIEAEDYIDNPDLYYDEDPENQGGGYRTRPVDVEPTSDIGGGFNLGWIESGEWLIYDVAIPEDGNYLITARVASDLDREHTLELSLGEETTAFEFGDTGGWQSWTDITSEAIALAAGNYQLRLDMGSSGFNVNYLDIIPEST